MPCITGRSSHTLCNPGCADANKCCRQTTSFSCQRYCFCEEAKKSPNNALVSVTDVRYMVCDAIRQLGSLNNDDLNPLQLAVNICDADFPNFECLVNLYLQQGTGAHIPLAAVFRGLCQNNSTDDTALAAGEWKVLVDNFECTTFTNTVTVP